MTTENASVVRLSQQTSRESSDDDPHIVIYHIEDEEDWRYFVRRAVEGLEGYHYYASRNSLRNAMQEYYQVIRSPSVIVFDLRHGVQPTEYGSIDWLLANANGLVKREVPIFIISGHLPGQSSADLSEYAGIPQNRIIDKDDFDSASFQRELIKVRSAQSHMKERLQHQDVIGDDPWVLKAEASIVDYDGVPEPLHVKAGRTYELEVAITSLPTVADLQSLNGKEIDVFVYAVGGKLSPESATIMIPKAYGVVSQFFKFTLKGDTDQGSSKLRILLYHQNHLLRHMEIELRVT